MLKSHLKNILSLLTLITIIVPSLRAQEAFDGEDFSFNDINYTIISVYQRTCRTKSYGPSENISHKNMKGELNIPSKITFTKDGNEYTVVEIGDYSFSNSLIESLKLPETIKRIGDYAFNSCGRIQGDLIIPASVTSIGNHAFDGCTSFSSLTIGKSVSALGDYAFKGCKSFTGSLTIGGLITTIGDHVFDGCTGFTSLTLGERITKIGDYAFNGCTGFTGSLTIGGSVTTIGNYAFNGCTGFTGDLEILSENTYIGAYAFYGCNEFAGKLTFPNNVSAIGNYAFANCSKLNIGKLKINGSLTEIGDGAFYGCIGIESIIIGDNINSSLTHIGDKAFSGCVGIKSIIIGDNITEIGAEAFNNNRFITSVTLGKSITKIGNFAFYQKNDVYSIDRLNINLDLKDWLNIDFGNEGSNPIRDVKEVYFGNNEFTELTLPDDIKEIKPFVFYEARTIQGNLKIPDSVETIGDYAFSGCYNLKGLTLGKSVLTIGSHAFSSCYNLTGDLIIPNSVTEIGNRAFYNCSKFKGTLTIGQNVTKIIAGAFSSQIQDKSDFERIIALPKEVPNSELSGPFDNYYLGYWKKNTPVIIPAGSEASYKNAYDWDYFTNYGSPQLCLTPSKDNPEILHVGDEVSYTLLVSIPIDEKAPKDIVSDLSTDIDSPKNAMVLESEENQTYKLKATHPGEATFIVRSELFNISAEVIIQVDAIPVEEFTLSSLSMEGKKGKSELKAGESLDFTVDIAPYNADYDIINWTVEPEDAAIIAVTDDGKGNSVTITFNENCEAREYTVRAQIDDTKCEQLYTINIEGPVLLGDANDSDDVTLADVITIANELLVKDREESSENSNFCFINSDIDKDKDLTLVDQTATINIAMGREPFPETDQVSYSTRSAVSIETHPTLYIDNITEGENHIGVTLENANDFVSLLLDVIVPVNMDIISVVKGEGLANHTIKYKLFADNRLRVLVYSLTNERFKFNDKPLFTIKATVPPFCGDLQFEEAVAVDKNVKESHLAVTGGNMGGTTSIDSIGIEDNNLPIDIYDITGKAVRLQVSPDEIDNLYPGLYIISRGNESQKIIVK